MHVLQRSERNGHRTYIVWELERAAMSFIVDGQGAHSEGLIRLQLRLGVVTESGICWNVVTSRSLAS